MNPILSEYLQETILWKIWMFPLGVQLVVLQRTELDQVVNEIDVKIIRKLEVQLNATSHGFGDNICKPWVFSFKRQPELVIIDSDSESSDEDYQNPGDSAKHNDSVDNEIISCKPWAFNTINSDSERDVGYTMPKQPKSASHGGNHKISKTEVKVKCPEQDAKNCATRKVDVSEREFQRAKSVIEEARAFKSKFPTCTIIMAPSHLRKDCHVYVPSEFTRDFLEKAGDSFFSLKDSTGKKWCVGYKLQRAKTCSSSRTRANMYKGWHKFASENHFKVGDACVFELVDIDNLEMKVNIIRVDPDMAFNTIHSDSESDDGRTMPTQPKSASYGGNRKISKTAQVKVHSPGQDASCASPKVDVSKRNFQRAMGVAKEVRAMDVSLSVSTITMKPTYICKGRSVHVPSELARYFLTKAGDKFVTLKDSTGKKWQVGYTVASGNKVSLYKGWHNFVLENHLKVGDASVFELVDIESLEMKVNIIRASQEIASNTINSDSDQSEEGSTMHTQPKSASHGGNNKKAKTGEVKVHCPWQYATGATRKVNVSERKSQSAMSVIKEARSFKSEFPTCTIIMAPSHVQKGSPVHVPCEFTRGFLQEACHNLVTLKDSTGRQWYVGYTISSFTNKAKFYKGWHDFVLDNRLKVGDACVFELVDIENLEMKVNIIRVSPDVV